MTAECADPDADDDTVHIAEIVEKIADERRTRQAD